MIRRFLPTDAERVSALIRNTLLISNTRDYDIETVRNLTQHFAPERLVTLSSRREVFVHEIEGRILGTISLEGSTIYGFFVVPDRQGEGIGKELLDHVERVSRVRGVRALQMSASITAAGFYEKMGYAAVGGEDNEMFGKTIIMRKELL
jgi:GNAT superfamily N-acetyltransferase